MYMVIKGAIIDLKKLQIQKYETYYRVASNPSNTQIKQTSLRIDLYVQFVGQEVFTYDNVPTAKR